MPASIGVVVLSFVAMASCGARLVAGGVNGKAHAGATVRKAAVLAAEPLAGSGEQRRNWRARRLDEPARTVVQRAGRPMGSERPAPADPAPGPGEIPGAARGNRRRDAAWHVPAGGLEVHRRLPHAPDSRLAVQARQARPVRGGRRTRGAGAPLPVQAPERAAACCKRSTAMAHRPDLSPEDDAILRENTRRMTGTRRAHRSRRSRASTRKSRRSSVERRRRSRSAGDRGRWRRVAVHCGAGTADDAVPEFS